MLEKEEIERISKIKNLSLKNTERDYLLEVLLFIIIKETGKKLVFKGGTALYKFYSLNRFSEDLDFTLVSKISIDKLTKKIILKLNDINIKVKIKELNEYKNQKNIKLELKGPLFNGSVNTLSLVTIDISLKEKPLYQAEQKTIFPQYRDIPSFNVFLMPLSELLAEKIRALLTRDKARDVYDVWFLLNKGIKFNIEEINKKLRVYKKKFNINEFIEKIEEKRKDWNTDLKYLIIGDLPEFDLVKEEIINKANLD